MSSRITPTFHAGSFTCPHCDANCQQDWAACTAEDDDGNTFGANLSLSTCFVCHEQAVWLHTYVTTEQNQRIRSGTLIHPTAERTGPPPNPDMPSDVAALYDEARAVATHSPRSASALTRLALEVLLKELYPKEGNLNAMIGAAVRDGLPESVQQTMDVMRFNGNRSVHEFHQDDTIDTASTLFGLLNFVVERLISQPKQLEELYAGLPQGVRESISKRDTKQT